MFARMLPVAFAFFSLGGVVAVDPMGVVMVQMRASSLSERAPTATPTWCGTAIEQFEGTWRATFGGDTVISVTSFDGTTADVVSSNPHQTGTATTSLQLTLFPNYGTVPLQYGYGTGLGQYITWDANTNNVWYRIAAGSCAATPTSAPTATTTGCPAGEKLVRINVTTDMYPLETSWTLVNACGDDLVAQSDGYSNKSTVHVTDVCVPAGKYSFTMMDSYGDGLCCGYGQGGYSVTYGGAVVASGDDFGTSETEPFGDSGHVCHPCDDGTHGCDSGIGGICHKADDGSNDWSCGCGPAYYCSDGCADDHSSHTCTLIAGEPPETILTAAANAGDTRLQVSSIAKFSKGDQVEIGDNNSKETMTVIDFGSLIFNLDGSLSKSFPIGARVVKVTQDTPRVSGDPHVWFHGARTTIHLPTDHFTKLLEQGDVAIYAIGGPTNMSMNYIHEVMVKVRGEEAVRVKQELGFLGQKDSLVKLTMDGIKYNGLRLKNTRETVEILHEPTGLDVIVGSRKTQRRDAVNSHHLNLRFSKGVVMSGFGSATGALPEIWGTQPLSSESRSLIVDRSRSGGSAAIENHMLVAGADDDLATL